MGDIDANIAIVAAELDKPGGLSPEAKAALIALVSGVLHDLRRIANAAEVISKNV